MLLNNLRDEYEIFQCLMIAILLNMMVEPIIEANPYYFLIVLMYLGAMDAKKERLQLNDTLVCSHQVYDS